MKEHTARSHWLKNPKKRQRTKTVEGQSHFKIGRCCVSTDRYSAFVQRSVRKVIDDRVAFVGEMLCCHRDLA